MKLTKENELHHLLKEQDTHGLYLLYGEDEYLISMWKQQIVAPFIPQGEFNYAVQDGRQFLLDDIYDTTQQLPVFATQRCVLVDGVDPKKLTADALKTCEVLFRDLPKETVLMFVFRAGELDASSATGKKMLALADKYGTVVELGYRTTGDLVKYLQKGAKQNGCELDVGQAKYMLRLCGNDLQVLHTELAKLTAYAAGRPISMEDIEAIVIPTTEEKVFDLSKAILSGNSIRALEILDSLMQNQESPLAVLSVLSLAYADLYRAALAKKMGIPLAEAATALGYKGREFRLRNAAKVGLSNKAIAASLEVLYDCDKRMKTTAENMQELLQETILTLLMIRGNNA